MADDFGTLLAGAANYVKVCVRCGLGCGGEADAVARKCAVEWLNVFGSLVAFWLPTIVRMAVE